MCSVLFLGGRAMSNLKLSTFFCVFSEFSMMCENEPIRLVKRTEAKYWTLCENVAVCLK